MTQMDFFDTEAIANLRQEIDKINRSTEKVRKGLFARHTALEQYMSELQTQIESLEREVYRLKKLAFEPDECQIREIEKVM